MKIKPFAVEEWMSTWEGGARYNIAETCVDSVSLDELFELTGENKELDYQIKVAKVKLSSFGIDYSELDF